MRGEFFILTALLLLIAISSIYKLLISSNVLYLNELKTGTIFSIMDNVLSECELAFQMKCPSECEELPYLLMSFLSRVGDDLETSALFLLAVKNQTRLNLTIGNALDAAIEVRLESKDNVTIFLHPNSLKSTNLTASAELKISYDYLGERREDSLNLSRIEHGAMLFIDVKIGYGKSFVREKRIFMKALT